MLSPQIIRTMLDYNYTYHRLVWEQIMTLTEEQFTAEIPYAHGSIRNHMVHLAAVDGGWLRGLHEDPNARANRPQARDYPTKAAARALLEATAADVSAYAATLDEAALQHHPKGLPTNVWQTLLHLVNHGTDHRAQVLRALHDLGAETFDQDLVFYFINR